MNRRKTEYKQITAEFERSVKAVTQSVASTAKVLERSTNSFDKVKTFENSTERFASNPRAA
ncbi:MAG: hypothetical protein AAF941_03245 [Pseudomonadota bacterium]